MADQKKINRGNRQRGAALEKFGADYLDMDVVPYSGSNTRFGFGDIRDSKWLGECKNITPDDDVIVVEIKWITKNNERAALYNKTPFILFMERGKPSKYVLITEDVMDNMITLSGPLMKIDLREILQCKGSHNAKNIRIGSYELRSIKAYGDMIKYGIDGNVNRYFIMRIELFKLILNAYKLKGERSMI